MSTTPRTPMFRAALNEAACAGVAEDGGTLLHAVLTGLLSETAEKTVKHTTPVAPGGNWRTRQVVRELKEIKSLTDLFLSEEQIRSVVISQEARCRVKLLNSFLAGQCLVEERALVCEEERRCRHFLTSAALSGLNTEASWYSIIGEEMYCRYCIEKSFIMERGLHRNLRGVQLHIILEQISRRDLMQKEMMNRRETEQRRFLAVSREIDMELLFQQFYRVNSWVRQASSKFAHDVSLLVIEEERDRCSLERLYLLKLSLLANDQENEAARLVVVSVMRASLMRRRMREDHRLREIASRLLVIPSKESDLRRIIERDEMEKRQALRVIFFTSWREVFKREPTPDSGAAIVERLEVYERHCLFDQWRFGFNTLDKRQNRERSALVRSENERNAFFHTVVDSLTALWKQESEQFNHVRKLYTEYVWSTRMLEATVVLEFEESCERRRILEFEVRDVVHLRGLIYMHELEEAMLREAGSITEVEEASRFLLAQWHTDAIAHHLTEKLCHAEERLRLEMELEAHAEWRDLMVAVAAWRGSSHDAVEELEATQRALLIGEERQRFHHHEFQAIVRMERLERYLREEAELQSRIAEYAVLLGCVESWNRLKLEAECQYEYLQISLSSTADREQMERASIQDSEHQRRSFLFLSVDYAFLHLRACEVDEIQDRLDIINEAEIMMGAMTYTHALYRRVQYCSEELRSTQAAMHFMSSVEHSQVQAVELVCAAEPLTRRGIVEHEMRERLLFTVVVHEQRGRDHIERAASDAYDAMQNLFDRMVSRDDEWQMRAAAQDPVVAVPSGREALLDYFRRREAGVSARLKAQREQTRELLCSFFEEFYWCRDTIVVEEFVARDGLQSSLLQPYLMLSCTSPTPASQLTLRFYSFAFTRSAELKPLSIRIFDTLDEVGITCELHEVQSIATAGTVFRVCFPTLLLEWVRPLDDKSDVIYFEVREVESGDVVGTACLLLRGEDLQQGGAGARVLSLPLDHHRGKMNVVLYVQ